MSDWIASARTARERLAQALGALQAPGVPESLLTVAEPVAKAMSSLHQIEASGGSLLAAKAPEALDFVRRALQTLQQQNVRHPAVDAAVESIASSLNLVHGLTRAVATPAVAAPPTQPASPHAMAMSAAIPSTQPAPQRQGDMAFAGTMVADGVSAADIVAKAQAQGAIPMGVGGTHPPMTKPSVGAYGTPPPGYSPPPAQAPADRTMDSPQGAGSGNPVSVAPPSAGLVRVEAALGAHSPTNFYKGLSGNDIIDAGGVFIATYQIPGLGQQLLIKVILPGGYEFEARGVVKWIRDSAHSPDAPPGYGAQFTQISPEGRQLIYRYVRNREPLFHDDL